MIARITLGKRYYYDDQCVTVVGRKAAIRGWTSNRVTIRYSDGSERTVLASHFRDEAEKITSA